MNMEIEKTEIKDEEPNLCCKECGSDMIQRRYRFVDSDGQTRIKYHYQCYACNFRTIAGKDWREAYDYALMCPFVEVAQLRK